MQGGFEIVVDVEVNLQFFSNPIFVSIREILLRECGKNAVKVKLWKKKIFIMKQVRFTLIAKHYGGGRSSIIISSFYNWCKRNQLKVLNSDC